MKSVVALLQVLLLMGCSGMPVHQQVALVANVLSVTKVVIDLGTGKREYIEVEVLGYGSDREKAREDAFRTAVVQSVGSVVVSQTQSNNQRLVRDEIISYSSGFVDRFEILSEKNLGTEIELRMRVWVAESRIARRLLADSSTAGQIDGKSLSLRLDGVLKERAQGDKLLQSVLADFPKRSFDIKLGSHRVLLDEKRQVTVEIPFELQWNYDYLASLYEALRVSHVEPEVCWSCILLGPQAETPEARQRRETQSTFTMRVKPPQNAIMRRMSTLIFDDELKIKAMHKAFIESQPKIRLTIEDMAGRTTFDKCYAYSQLDHQIYGWYPDFYFFRVDSWFKRASINGDNVLRGVLPIKLHGSPSQKVRDFEHVTMTVVTNDQCTRSR